jgi:YQGE family putative transporter
MILRFLHGQKAKFNIFTAGAKKLLLSNMLFGLFGPFYLIFSNTFIFNNSKGNIGYNLLYNLFNFIGIISGFAINGFLIRIFHVKNQLIVGMGLIFISITTLFFIPPGFLNGTLILIFGLFTGIGNGIYWSSRNYLTVTNTHDGNRDFFTGLDYILINAGRIIIPVLVGFYLGTSIQHQWFSVQIAYKSILIVAFLLVFFASIFIINESFNNARTGKFFYVVFNKKWNNTRLMAFYIAIYQGAAIAIPPIFIMKYVGNESSVGSLYSFGSLLAIIIIYFLSSRSRVEHRSRIIRSGIILLLTGAIFFSCIISLNSMVAMSVLIIIMSVADPLINFPFRATFMKVIDELKHSEKKDDYSYIFDLELVTAIGRVMSISFFFLIYNMLSPGLALSIYMVIISILLFLILPLSKKINGK